MAIQTTQRQYNLREAIETYVQNTLEAVDGVTVRHPGVVSKKDRTIDHDNFVVLAYVGNKTQDILRNVNSDGNLGAIKHLLVQFTCISRVDPTDPMALERLVDKVLGRFHLGAEIRIRDAANANTTYEDVLVVVDYDEEWPQPPTVKASWGIETDVRVCILTFVLKYVAASGPTA